MPSMIYIRQRAEALIPQVEAILRSHRLEEYEVRAFKFLVERLGEIRDEAKCGGLKQTPDRKGEMARVVAESDPSVLDPVLGGALTEIEAEYYSVSPGSRNRRGEKVYAKGGQKPIDPRFRQRSRLSGGGFARRGSHAARDRAG